MALAAPESRLSERYIIRRTVLGWFHSLPDGGLHSETPRSWGIGLPEKHRMAEFVDYRVPLWDTPEHELAELPRGLR